MRAWPTAVAWLVVGTTLGACAGRGRDRITLAIARLPAFGLVFIAEAKGYFAEQGVTVEQRRFTSGRDALSALSARQVDAATVFETPVARVAGAERGLRVLTTLHVANRGTAVVARTDRHVRGAEDLAGKRVGVPRNTHADYFLHVVLAYAGLPDAAVETVDLAPERTVDALVAGDVDAIAIWPPHVERARRTLGAGGAVEIGVPVYTEISMLVTREDLLAGRRRAFVKVLRALAQAEQLVRERPEEAFAALRSELSEVGEADLRDAWGRVAPQLGLTNQLAAGLEREADWLRARGRVDGPRLDVGVLLRGDVLAEVDLEAVTFVSPAGAQPSR